MVTKLSWKEIWSGIIRLISSRAFVRSEITSMILQTIIARYEVQLPLLHHFEITQLSPLVVCIVTQRCIIDVPAKNLLTVNILGNFNN